MGPISEVPNNFVDTGECPNVFLFVLKKLYRADSDSCFTCFCSNIYVHVSMLLQKFNSSMLPLVNYEIV